MYTENGCEPRFVYKAVQNDALGSYIETLPPDTGLRVRLKDEVAHQGVWQHGIALRQGKHLFILLNGSGTPVELPISSLHSESTRLALEFAYESEAVRTELSPVVSQLAPLLPAFSRENIVIINHGYSPEWGPNYRYIRSLEEHIRQTGRWQVIVPDFRKSYKFESSLHGHSERMRMLVEELACLGGRQKRVVLIGKSQGCAVSGAVCTNQKLVLACKIVGLVLVGGENPLSYDRSYSVPQVPHMAVIHAAGYSTFELSHQRHLVCFVVPL
jgi:hypothetical protein